MTSKWINGQICVWKEIIKINVLMIKLIGFQPKHFGIPLQPPSKISITFSQFFFKKKIFDFVNNCVKLWKILQRNLFSINIF